MTKIINLLGSPGSGKSTCAAGIFYRLKLAGINVELVTEVAKDFVWSKRYNCMRSQPLIFGKQLYRIERLIDKVDIVVTDSPIILSPVYADNYPQSFTQFVVDVFNTFDNVNYFVQRVKPYVPIGRRQSAESSAQLAEKIKDFLLDKAIPYSIIEGNEQAVIGICDDILGRLGRNTGATPKSCPIIENDRFGKRWRSV